MKHHSDWLLYAAVALLSLMSFVTGKAVIQCYDRIDALESTPPCPCQLEPEAEAEPEFDLPRFPKGRVR